MNDIAFWSPTPQQGKSTAAEFLELKYGYRRLSFAEPLRSMIGALMASAGLNYNQVYFYMNEGKEHQIPVVGRSFRDLARTLGTEWGRNLVDQDLWTNIAKQKILEPFNEDRVCVDDMRFQNEADLLRFHGFKLVKVVRDTGRQDSHTSDTALANFEGWNHVITNDGTLEEFYEKIEAIL